MFAGGHVMFAASGSCGVLEAGPVTSGGIVCETKCLIYPRPSISMGLATVAIPENTIKHHVQRTPSL